MPKPNNSLMLSLNTWIGIKNTLSYELTGNKEIRYMQSSLMNGN